MSFKIIALYSTRHIILLHCILNNSNIPTYCIHHYSNDKVVFFPIINGRVKNINFIFQK